MLKFERETDLLTEILNSYVKIKNRDFKLLEKYHEMNKTYFQ